MTTTIDRPRTAVGDDWWDDLDRAILDCVARDGATSPEEVARAVGISPDGASSLLGMLAREGKVRISLVESVGRRRAAAA